MKITDPYCRASRGETLVILSEPGNPALVVNEDGTVSLRSLNGVRGHHDYDTAKTTPKQRQTTDALVSFLAYGVEL